MAETEKAGRVPSPRRPRFAMSRFGDPVRSEIGPYQTTARRGARLDILPFCSVSEFVPGMRKKRRERDNTWLRLRRVVINAV
jgi:hypothetical protein